jgi:phospholipid transport system substrate-binding protein
MAKLSRSQALFRVVALSLALLAGFTAAVADNTAAPGTPQATIEAVTREVRAALDARKEALQKNPARVAAVVAKITDPYLDYTAMSEEALGVAWRRADAQQKARFTKAFHQLLTQDYTATLKQYSGQTVRVTGERWEDAQHHRVLVSSEVQSPGEKPIDVGYRMYRTGGRWKVYDVIVEGTSLLINYRESFADQLQHESLDALVSQLEKKVAENQAGGSQ